MNTVTRPAPARTPGTPRPLPSWSVGAKCILPGTRCPEHMCATHSHAEGPRNAPRKGNLMSDSQRASPRTSLAAVRDGLARLSPEGLASAPRPTRLGHGDPGPRPHALMMSTVFPCSRGSPFSSRLHPSPHPSPHLLTSSLAGPRGGGNSGRWHGARSLRAAEKLQRPVPDAVGRPWSCADGNGVADASRIIRTRWAWKRSRTKRVARPGFCYLPPSSLRPRRRRHTPHPRLHLGVCAELGWRASPRGRRRVTFLEGHLDQTRPQAAAAPSTRQTL